MFPSSNASDAEKYPISVESKLHLSESVAVSFVIQHCDAFSKKNTQRSNFQNCFQSEVRVKCISVLQEEKKSAA